MFGIMHQQIFILKIFAINKNLLKYEMIWTREQLKHDWFIPKDIWDICDYKALVDYFQL